MTSTRRLLLPVGLLALGLAAACGSDSTDPGHSAPAIPIALNDTVYGEITTSETDSFQLTFTDSTLVAIYLETFDSNATQLEADNHTTLAFWVYGPFPPGLTANRTTRFMVPAGEKLIIRVGPVAGGKPEFFPGRYRFLVQSIDPAPGTGPATLALGDSTAEQSLVNSADLDVWTLTPTFLDTVGFQPWIELTTPSSAGELRFDTDQPGYTTGLPPSGTGYGPARWTLPIYSSAYPVHWRLMVGSPDPPLANPNLPQLPRYRLGVTLVDYRPEHVPIFPAANDTVTGEAVDSTGDVDVFLGSYDTSALGHIAVVQILGGAVTDSLVIHTDSVLGDQTLYGGDTTFGSLAVTLPQTVRDGQPAWRLALTGYPSNPGAGPLPYRFAVFDNTGLPEVAAATLTLGDTTSEAIDFPGDVDQFSVTVQSLPFRLQLETSPAIVNPVRVRVSSSPTVSYGTWDIPAGTALADSLITVPLPAPGTYQVRIGPVVRIRGHGSYRILAR